MPARTLGLKGVDCDVPHIAWREDDDGSYMEDLKLNTNKAFSQRRRPNKEAKPGRAGRKPCVRNCNSD